MTEDELVPLSPTNMGLSGNFNDTFAKLEEHLRNNSSGSCCRNVSLKSRIKNSNVEKQTIYMAQLWTLAEERWTTERSLSYNSNAPCPNNPVGDIWQDYEFDSPTTTILNPRELSIIRDLERTRRREDCSKCQNNNQSQCSHCQNRRSIVICSQLTVRRSTTSFSFVYPNNAQSIIQTTTNKIKCLDFDDVWPANTENLDHILDESKHHLPVEFRREINNRFRTHQRSDKILRLKCLIECLYIEKITYQLNGYPEQNFTFYLVGEERNFHPSEFPYPPRTGSMPCSIL